MNLKSAVLASLLSISMLSSIQAYAASSLTREQTAKAYSNFGLKGSVMSQAVIKKYGITGIRWHGTDKNGNYIEGTNLISNPKDNFNLAKGWSQMTYISNKDIANGAMFAHEEYDRSVTIYSPNEANF